jgi:hypothetical protein
MPSGQAHFSYDHASIADLNLVEQKQKRLEDSLLLKDPHYQQECQYLTQQKTLFPEASAGERLPTYETLVNNLLLATGSPATLFKSGLDDRDEGDEFLPAPKKKRRRK